MKKLLLFIALAIAGQTYLSAQEFGLGAKAGVNFANIGGDDYDGKSKTGFHVGLVAEFMLTDRFGIQPEVLYSTQGTKIEESGTEFGMSYNIEAKQNLDYINVPVLVKYYFTDALSLEFGPQIGFLVKGEQDYTMSFDGETESGKEDIKEYVKSTDFGLAAGLGYKFNGGLFVNARYVLGLSNINDENQEIDDILDEFSSASKIKNNVFQISLGFMF